MGNKLSSIPQGCFCPPASPRKKFRHYNIYHWGKLVTKTLFREEVTEITETKTSFVYNIEHYFGYLEIKNERVELFANEKKYLWFDSKYHKRWLIGKHRQNFDIVRCLEHSMVTIIRLIFVSMFDPGNTKEQNVMEIVYRK